MPAKEKVKRPRLARAGVSGLINLNVHKSSKEITYCGC